MVVALAPTDATCTSIVVIRTPQDKAVIIGADSLIQPFQAEERHGCKIHQISATRFVAMAGMVQEDSPSSLDRARQFVKLPLLEEMRSFYRTASTAAKPKVIAVSSDPELHIRYSDQLGGKKPWLTAVFAERDGKDTKVARVELYIQKFAIPRTFRFRPKYFSCPGIAS